MKGSSTYTLSILHCVRVEYHICIICKIFSRNTQTIPRMRNIIMHIYYLVCMHYYLYMYDDIPTSVLPATHPHSHEPITIANSNFVEVPIVHVTNFNYGKLQFWNIVHVCLNSNNAARDVSVHTCL